MAWTVIAWYTPPAGCYVTLEHALRHMDVGVWAIVEVWS
ncbi:MAG: hypothetical protein QOG31_222 [Thermoplasmata archaeon]|jgi:hypothetical protein|nr:hypothetical protein [Thermoplasmata archaeon]